MFNIPNSSLHDNDLLAPSGALIAIPTYYWSPPPHFFRSHRSSTLDFHFLSHYSYIKAMMLYKGKTWQDSGILWNNLACSGILWHTLAYSCILWHTLAYSGIQCIISASLLTADGAYHCPVGSIWLFFLLVSLMIIWHLVPNPSTTSAASIDEHGLPRAVDQPWCWFHYIDHSSVSDGIGFGFVLTFIIIKE